MDSYGLGLSIVSKRRKGVYIYGFEEKSGNKVKYLYSDGVSTGECQIKNMGRYMEVR